MHVMVAGMMHSNPISAPTRAEPDNPDILYNLAISLEHLRQNKLAAQYYGQAIAAAQNRPAGFDKAQAAARLQTLRP
jgi:hypothetical protein